MDVCTQPPAGYQCSRTTGHAGPCAATRGERYGDWHIEYNPPPIPTRNCDWQFWHDDYDGAPDAHDNRCGSAASLEDAKMEIDMIEDMDRDMTEAEEDSVHRSLVKMREMMLFQRAPMIIRNLLNGGTLTAVHISAARQWLDDHDKRNVRLASDASQ